MRTISVKSKKSKRSLYGQGIAISQSQRQLEILNETLDYSPSFQEKLEQHGFVDMKPSSLEILQINLGYMCNLTCEHCHVDAGPDRKEKMSREVLNQCLRVLDESKAHTVDLTGGAPEMHPDFLWLIEELSKREVKVLVRSNLTILVSNSKYRKYPELMAKHGVTIVASMPCYTPENVDKQRGEGVFDQSIEALQILNELGFGRENSELCIHLVYNPLGPSLPGNQSKLEADYKQVLKEHFNIEFNDLYCIANLPISRFLNTIYNEGKLEKYMHLLVESFNPSTVEGLMCRNTLSVRWDGVLYDCDFNQMLEMPLNIDQPFVKDFRIDTFTEREVVLHQHCYGCTAGAGSSCQGSLS